ncbi:MAG TPA: FAD binding domain-containing protein [Stellaceae bacterium]|nr:FAD binding domain-containing protein [Stellaceae bacterium]
MPFEFVEPLSLDAALALLDPEDPEVRPIAGGTALMLMLKSGLFRPRRLVGLRRIEDGLTEIAASPQGALRLGAMLRLADLAAAPAVRTAAPVIAESLAHHSNVRVRNAATLGGNLAHADPHMDLPPVLIALDAEIEAASPRGRRRLPVESLYRGYLETALAGDELIAALLVPPQRGRRAGYAKVTTRSAEDWPALGLAVSLALDGGRVAEARIVIGAATEVPMRLKRAEALLAGAAIDDRFVREAGRIAAEEAPVVADWRGSAAYKKVLVEVHLARLLRRVLELAQ